GLAIDPLAGQNSFFLQSGDGGAHAGRFRPQILQKADNDGDRDGPTAVPAINAENRHDKTVVWWLSLVAGEPSGNNLVFSAHAMSLSDPDAAKRSRCGMPT